MKVILYIGHHKVGSTSLQVFLSQNSLALARSGILYPAVETMGFAHFLAKALKGADEPGQLPINAREPHNALAYRMLSEVSSRQVPPRFTQLPHSSQMLLAIQRQVELLAPDSVVLCAEALANFGPVAPQLIPRLCGLFPGAEFQIYCALRRPDDYLTSWHGQRLKTGQQLDPLRDAGLAPYFGSLHFDYRRVVAPWIEALPDARITLRNYRDILAAGGSIEDFVQQAEIAFPAGLLPAERANKSLPLAVVEIARLGNRALAAPDGLALIQFLLTATDDLGLTPNREIEMFGPENRARIVEMFRPVEDYLRGVTGQPAFFPDLERIAELRPVAELAAMKDSLARLTPERIAALPSKPARNFLTELRRQHGIG